ARNYLLPRKLAIEATAGTKRVVADSKASALRKEAKLKGDAEQLAGLMKDVVITVAEKAGDTEQLFGSVTAMRIAEELGKQGYNIDRHKIEIEQPIRMLGEHTVTVNL